MTHAIEESQPNELPPTASTAIHDAGEGAPTIDIGEISAAQSASLTGGPESAPPAEANASGVASEQGFTAWHNSVKISSLWCNASARNAWVAVQGIGWRRINPANDSSFVSMNTMLSHARHTNANCKLRIESDKLIHEVYVW